MLTLKELQRKSASQDKVINSLIKDVEGYKEEIERLKIIPRECELQLEKIRSQSTEEIMNLNRCIWQLQKDLREYDNPSLVFALRMMFNSFKGLWKTCRMRFWGYYYRRSST